MCVVGTRPECIKMAPVVRALRARGNGRVLVVSTGQHRDLVAQELREFDLTVDFDLDVMRENQTLSGLSARIFDALDPLLVETEPALVLVQGDTTSVMAAALCAFHRRIPVGHVEAGLRTHDVGSPFPEEMNRRVTTVVTQLHFAPTAGARDALRAEGVAPGRVFLTGNTVIDALAARAAHIAPPPAERPRRILLTAHRRENHGDPIRRICGAVRRLVETFPDLEVVYPVHPNPNISGPVRALLGGVERVVLLPPLGYGDLIAQMMGAQLVLTDSGGIQEEAPALGLPVLVLREETERPEAVAAGAAILVGTDEDRIVAETTRLLLEADAREAMTGAGSPYGDGRAAERIAEICCAYLEGRPPVVDEFAFGGSARHVAA